MLEQFLKNMIKNTRINLILRTLVKCFFMSLSWLKKCKMKLSEGLQVKYVTRAGRKGVGIITIEGGQTIMCHNDPDLHDYVPLNQNYGFQYALRLQADPVKAGQLHSFQVEEPYNDTQILEKSTQQGTLFRKVYKEFENVGLIFVGAVHKNIDDCAKPSAIITPMDLKYLKETGWKPVVKSESAEDQLKRQSRKKY